MQSGGVIVAASQPEAEAAAQKWLSEALAGKTERAAKRPNCCCRPGGACRKTNRSTDPTARTKQRQAGWREAIKGKVVEIGWLARQSLARGAHYRTA